MTTVPLNGAIVFWTSATPTTHDMRIALDKLGMGIFMPPRRAPVAILLSALKEYVQNDPALRGTTLIRPIKSADGYTLVTERRDDQGNSYSTTDTFTVTEGHTVYMNTLDMDPLHRMVHLYSRHRNVCTVDQVTQVAKRIALEGCQGVSLRPHSAMYYIPDSHMPAWDTAIIELTASLCLTAHKIRTGIDSQAQEAITAALSAETNALIEKVKTTDAANGGAKAYNARANEMRVMTDKLHNYSISLGLALTNLKKATIDSRKYAVRRALQKETAVTFAKGVAKQGLATPTVATPTPTVPLVKQEGGYKFPWET